MPEQTWRADGHAARVVVEDLTLQIALVCPHDPAVVAASPRESWPACWRVYATDPVVAVPGECGVAAIGAEYRDDELWVDGTADFEVTAAPFAMEWFEDPDDGIVIRPAMGAVAWLGEGDADA